MIQTHSSELLKVKEMTVRRSGTLPMQIFIDALHSADSDPMGLLFWPNFREGEDHLTPS